MGSRSRLTALAVCLVSVGPAIAGEATLVVRVQGIGSGLGHLKAAICATGFDRAGCPVGASRVPGHDTEDFVFSGLDPGRYAVAVYFDTNGNGELDTVLGGVPTEPFAFSNDVGRRAPPDFREALVPVGPGRTLVTLRLRRLFDSS
jgi:uncharacterized protein (DUF2141 family)